MRDKSALRAFVVKRRNDKQSVRSERREKSAKSHSRFRVVRAAADDDGDAPVRGFYRKLHDVDFSSSDIVAASPVVPSITRAPTSFSI